MIPDHYDNLAYTAWEPNLIVNQFERIAEEMAPQINTTIMQHGGMYQYPRDRYMKHYRYENESQGIDVTRIPAYQKLATKFEPINK